MLFLRRRGDRVEQAHMDANHTARELRHAKFILGDAVVIARHPYLRNPEFGTCDWCWCGHPHDHTLHVVVVAQ